MQASTLITPRLAEEAINSRLTCLPIESLPLTQCVGGTLRENIYAERDQPPFDRVAHGRYRGRQRSAAARAAAFSHPSHTGAGSPALKLAPERGHRGDDRGHSAAGERLCRAGRAVRGRRRLCVTQGDGGIDVLSQRASPRHRRPAGRAAVADAERCCAPPEIAVAASAGMARVRVSSQPAVMVVSTGDELIEPGDPIADYQVRRSNAYAVAATLRRRGFARVGDDHVLDDEGMLRERLALHLTTHEVAGPERRRVDGQVRSRAARCWCGLGVQEVFHNIAQRPGKPMWFGIGPQGQAVFGLPGNPVSTLVCLIRYVIPAIAEAMGTTPQRARAPGARGAGDISARRSPTSCRSPSSMMTGAVPGPIRARPMGREIF